MLKKILIFDLGNVIINLKSDDTWLHEDLLPNFNQIQLQSLSSSGFFQHYETGQFSSDSFINQLKEIAINTDISNNEIIKHWNAILLDIPHHRIELLKQLKKNYRLCLLSNTNDIHLTYILNYLQSQYGYKVFDELFEIQFYSHKMGLRKPDAIIYETVLQQLNVSAQEICFFDDKPENLVEPNKLGMSCVLVDKDIAALTKHLL